MERFTSMPNPFYYLIHEPNIQWIKVEDACWGETLKDSKFFKGQTDNHKKHSSSTSRVKLTENKTRRNWNLREPTKKKAINDDTEKKYLSCFGDHWAPFSKKDQPKASPLSDLFLSIPLFFSPLQQHRYPPSLSYCPGPACPSSFFFLQANLYPVPSAAREPPLSVSFFSAPKTAPEHHVERLRKKGRKRKRNKINPNKKISASRGVYSITTNNQKRKLICRAPTKSQLILHEPIS